MRKMVKLVLTLSFIGAISFNSYAQEDISDLYNKAIQAIQAEDFNNAITLANQTYEAIKANPEAAGDVKIETLEELIPQLHLSKAKKAFAADEYAEALKAFTETAEVAKKFKQAGIETEATEFIPKIYLKEANDLYNADNYDGAIALFDKALAIDTANTQAYFIRAVSFMKKGDNTSAVEALEKTVESAKATSNATIEGQANTQLGNIYLKAAADAQKTKKWADVITNAEKSLSYKDNPTALKLIDLGNYQSGAALQASNKTKACQYFKKVTNDAQLKKAAIDAMAVIGCK